MSATSAALVDSQNFAGVMARKSSSGARTPRSASRSPAPMAAAIRSPAVAVVVPLVMGAAYDGPSDEPSGAGEDRQVAVDPRDRGPRRGFVVALVVGPHGAGERVPHGHLVEQVVAHPDGRCALRRAQHGGAAVLRSGQVRG